MALRRIGVTAIGESPAGEDMTVAQDALDAFLSEIKETDGATFTWTSANVPDEAALSLSRVVACEIAGMFERPMQERYAAAVGRFRKFAFPDDRAEFRDYDEDGTVSTTEKADGLEAQYY